MCRRANGKHCAGQSDAPISPHKKPIQMFWDSMENDSNDGPFPLLYTLLTEDSESTDRSETILPGIIVIMIIITIIKKFSLMLSCFWNPTLRVVFSVCFPFSARCFVTRAFKRSQVDVMEQTVQKCEGLRGRVWMRSPMCVCVCVRSSSLRAAKAL